MATVHMRTLTISCLILFLTTSLLVSQQKHGGFAGYGPEGVVIQLRGPLVGNLLPLDDQQWIGFNIERTNLKSLQVKRITSTPLSFPSTLDELKRRSASHWLTFTRLTNANNDNEVWERILKNDGSLSFFLLFSPELAEIAGQRVLDRTVSRGERYRYRVTLVNNQGLESEPVLVTEVLAEPKQILPPQNTSSSGDERAVRISWESSPSPEAAFYHVFRSPDSTRGFQRMNAMPVIILQNRQAQEKLTGGFIDTTVQAGWVYYYSVRAADPFGNFSEPTLPLRYEAVDTTSPSPPDSLTAISMNGFIRISWPLPQSKQYDGVHIFRAESARDEFQQITKDPIPHTINHYDDGRIEAYKPYFYRVKSVKANRKTSGFSNLAFADWQLRTPPLPPTGVHGEPVTQGIKVAWSPSESRFVDGYYVYRSDFFDGPRSLVSPLLKDTVFVDSSGYLNARASYWYSIRAVTASGLEGMTSEPIPVKAGKPVLLSAPENLFGSADPSGIVLQWKRPAEGDPTHYRIYRSDANASEFQPAPAAFVPDSFYHWIDTTVAPGKSYRYHVNGVTAGGHEGEPSPFITVTTASRTLHRVKTVRIFLDANSFVVTWEAHTTQPDVHYQVYRRTASTEPRMITDRPLPSDSLIIYDTNVSEDERYFYSVEVISEDGERRARSDEVHAVFRKTGR
jgi:fibronectin type 3 domain-containing protein